MYLSIQYSRVTHTHVLLDHLFSFLALHLWYRMCRVLPPESEAGECNWSLVREDFEAWTDPTSEVALPCQDYKDYEDIPPLNMEVCKKNFESSSNSTTECTC